MSYTDIIDTEGNKVKQVKSGLVYQGQSESGSRPDRFDVNTI